MVGNCDAFPLRTIVRLDDVCNSWVMSHFILQEPKLKGQNEGVRKEVKVGDSVFDLHFRYAFIHEILSCEVKGIRKVVDLLIGQQTLIDLHF